MGHARDRLDGGDAGGCTDAGPGVDPRTAEREPIDRFSAAAGRLMVRTATNGLPAANEAIDYDARFITHGLAPDGRRITHYDFDVKPRAPAAIYVFFESGQATPVRDQLNVVTVIPGDPGYNDLWQVVKVEVPEGYVANRVTSLAEIVDAGYVQTTTSELVNCPMVPEGSVARTRMPGGYAELRQGWYRGKIIQYFHFGEKLLMATAGEVPVSAIHVAYNVNPGQPGGGAASGYLTEAAGAQTHNVVATMPTDAAYSPLWSVSVYDNAAFATVLDLATAQAAAVVPDEAVIVNSPIAAIEP